MKFRLIPLVLAAALACTGCAAESADAEPAETLVVYKALPLPDLFVSIPEGYEETSSRFYEKFYIKDDATIIITEDNEKGSLSAKDYSADALNQYEKITKTLDILGTDTVYAGQYEVQLLEFTYTVEGDEEPMTTMVGYCGDGFTMYIITCKCSAANYQQHREEFLTVIRSQKPDKSWMGAAERAGQADE